MSETVQAALLHLSLNIAAFIFDLVLCFLQLTFGRGKSRNRRFLTLSVFVLFGIVFSCMDSLFRRDYLFDVPQIIPVITNHVAYGSNIFLTYFFARYIESFFDVNFKSKLSVFNSILMGFSVLFLVFGVLWKVPMLNGTQEMVNMSQWYRYVTGFVIELYYLVYSAVFFIRRRKELDKRAVVTAVVAFCATIGIIALEAFNKTGIYLNYFGAVLGLYVFYVGNENSDYKYLIRTMRELEESKKKADNANQSKSDFLASMSHEIRTPLNAVIGMNEMILRESENPTVISYAKNVESAGNNLLSIINDILDFSKIEAGKLELVESPYKFSSVINDVVNMISIKASSKGLDFEAKVDELLPDGLIGDEVRIRQVMVNILNNAVKYTNKGFVNLSITGERTTTTVDLCIKVTDSGIGIREEDIPKLFGKFERVDLGQNKTVEGTGLGLAITRSLLGMMKGDIEVESIYGKGSTFIIHIPQKIASDEPIGDYHKKFEMNANESRLYKETFIAPDAHILVVDDMPMNLTVITRLLKKTKINIDTAKSGDEALKLTMGTTYDLIFMDQLMPQMDGSKVLHHIRNQLHGMNIETPVICLTADAVSGAKERYLTEGFTDYLSKPVKGYALEAILSEHLPKDKVIRIEDDNESKEDNQ